ncbi:MerR family transcriptional regulator [Floccifex sp.]|uniref:MerR family transcriptional regulator n=1 Tax=Floccifex sp. TaxID=2815810 RepID=UPI003F0DE7B6
MKDLTLKEVCTQLNISRRAIQGYEKEQLVKPSGKNNRGYLLYDQETIKRIKQIKLFQDMGFSLKEIKNIIDDSGTELKDALLKRKEKLNQEIIKNESMIQIIEQMLTSL